MIYRALKNEAHLRGKSQFYRILPRGVTLDGFGMDELDVKAMIKVSRGYRYNIMPLDLVLGIDKRIIRLTDGRSVQIDGTVSSNH